MEVISKLKSIIDPIISLTDEEFSIFRDSVEIRRLSKNELFLKEGQICDFIGFVSKGILIYFKSMENGDEKTTDFAFEGDWVTSNESRLNIVPSLINIKAIVKSELVVVKQQTLSDLYIRIPKLERLGRIIMEREYLKIAQQSIDLQVLTAKERYEKLLNKCPEIFQTVQLYHIANYLGIAPKSLSRIRRELFE